MASQKHIVIVESFYTGSHRYWCDSLKKYLTSDVTLLHLPGRHWKWRMSAAAVELAEKANGLERLPDVFLVSDLIDVCDFKALLKPGLREVPVVLYMHENQVVYPFQTTGEERNRDRHYGMVNYKSVLCADEIWFNSQFHKDIFCREMKTFLSPFPESSRHINRLEKKITVSYVVPLGIDTAELESMRKPADEKPTILWNHRWEFDKNPTLFFDALVQLDKDGLDFDLIVCGEQYSQQPPVFEEMRIRLAKHIIHWGYYDSRADYVRALWQSNILPVTSNQEFFGLSVMEAAYCGCTPVLPNRLSYPEIYPQSVFYKADNELYGKLKELIQTRNYLDVSKTLGNFAWEQVAQKYEEGFTRLLG